MRSPDVALGIQRLNTRLWGSIYHYGCQNEKSPSMFPFSTNVDNFRRTLKYS